MSGDRDGAGKGALHYLWLGLSGGLFALVVLLAGLVIVVPALAGATPMTILTGSMEPHLPPGTLVVVKPTPVADIRLGDVVTYQIRSGDPAVVSHRVVAINALSDGGTTFITKGDNNDSADEAPVTAPQVRGVVWYSVPWIGYVNSAVNGENRSWIMPALAIALLGYAGSMLLGGLLGLARKGRSRERRPGARVLPLRPRRGGG